MSCLMSKELACASINELAKKDDCRDFIDNFRKSVLLNTKNDISTLELEKLWFTSVQQELEKDWEHVDGFKDFLSRLNISDPLALAGILKKIADAINKRNIFDKGCDALFFVAAEKKDYQTQLKLAYTNVPWTLKNKDKVQPVIIQSLALLRDKPLLLEPLQMVFKHCPCLHKLTSDVQFITSDQEIVPAHKAILQCTKSNYIQNILSGKWKDEQKPISSQFDSHTLTTLIEYYEKGIPVSDETPIAVWEAACYYQMEAVQDMYERCVVVNQEQTYLALLAAMRVGRREFERRCLCTPFFPDSFDDQKLQQVPEDISSDLAKILLGYSEGVYLQEQEGVPTLSITDLSSDEAVDAAQFYLQRHQITSIEVKSAAVDIIKASDKKLEMTHLRIDPNAVKKEWVEDNVQLQIVQHLTYIGSSPDYDFPFIAFDECLSRVQSLHIKTQRINLSAMECDSFRTFVKEASNLKQVRLSLMDDFTTFTEFELLLEAFSENKSIEQVKLQFTNKRFVKVLKERKMQFSAVKNPESEVFECTISHPSVQNPPPLA